MTREMKVGMAVIGVLLTAFSGVLYKRLHKSDDLPEAAAERPAAAGAKPQKTPPAMPGRNVAKLPSELEAESAASGSSSKKAKATSSRRSASSTASDSSSDPFARASASTSASKPSPRYAADSETSDSETSDSETSESESSEDSSEVEESDFPAPRRRYAISDTVNDDADAESSSDDDIPMADDRYSETLDEVEEEEPPSYRGRYRMAADDSREDEESEDTSSSEEFDPVEGSYDDSEDEIAATEIPPASMEFPERPARDADAARTSFQDRMNHGARLDEPLPRSLDSEDSDEAADEDSEPYSPGPAERPFATVPRATVPPTNPPRATIRRNQPSPIETAEDAGGADPELEPESIAAPRSGGRSGNTYVVTAGESLFDIARQELGAASQWTELYDLNHDRLTGDLESLPAGLKLDLPTRQARTPRTNSAGRLRLR